MKGPSLLAALCAILSCGCEPAGDAAPSAAAAAQAALIPEGQGFDFYVLSLSWSPSYCEAEGENANRRQCDSGLYPAFVVHGLWPQFERGYPEYCPSREPERVPDALVRRNLDLIPSAGLIGHQWRKHGSCSGLSQRDYFDRVREAWQRITVPAAYDGQSGDRQVDPERVEADFLSANPEMAEDGISITCDGRYLREVRICLTRDLSFRNCPLVEEGACRAGRRLLPAGE